MKIIIKIRKKEIEVSLEEFINSQFSKSHISINNGEYFDYFRKFKIMLSFFLGFDKVINLKELYNKLDFKTDSGDSFLTAEAITFFLDYCSNVCYNTKNIRLINYLHITNFFKHLLTKALERNCINNKKDTIDKINLYLKSSLQNLDSESEENIYSHTLSNKMLEFIKLKEKELTNNQIQNIGIITKGYSEISNKVNNLEVKLKLWRDINFNLGFNLYIKCCSILKLVDNKFPEEYLESLDIIKRKNSENILAIYSFLKTKDWGDLIWPIMEFLGYNHIFVYEEIYENNEYTKLKIMNTEINEKIKSHSHSLIKLKKEVKKIIVGQDHIIDSFLRAIIAEGHVLIEGVPGLAKTTLIRVLSKILGCKFNRIQFTADLLPTDILGLNTYQKDIGFHVIKGPIFTNIILADEINRVNPKTQSALIEAMGERKVTIGKKSFDLERPFLVFATENPIESAGTYPLPAAQLDRFLFKVFIDYPKLEDEYNILKRKIGDINIFEDKIDTLFNPKLIREIQNMSREIFVSPKIKLYVVNIIEATRNHEKYSLKLGRFIKWGASPRGTINIISAARAEALIHGRSYVTEDDILIVLKDVLRHRIIVNYEGHSKNITPDHIINEIISIVRG